jgi:hypothetical protein
VCLAVSLARSIVLFGRGSCARVEDGGAADGADEVAVFRDIEFAHFLEHVSELQPRGGSLAALEARGAFANEVALVAAGHDRFRISAIHFATGGGTAFPAA